MTSIHNQEGRTVRRLVPIAAATVTAILLTAACATGEAAQNEHSQGATPTLADATLVSTPPASPVVAEPAIAPPARTGLPATFVAVRDKTRLVVVETATGKVQRVLYDLGPQEEEAPQMIDGLALSPDGTTAFFSVGPEPAVGVLYQVAVAGGPAARVGWGRGPAVSPDGRRLAYLNLQTVVVDDLPTGTFSHYAPDEERMIDPWALAWSPDSRHLVFAAQDEESSGSLRVLDTSIPGTLAGSRRLADRSGEGELWLTGVRASDGLVGAIVAPFLPQSDVAEPGRVFVLLDPATGAEKDRLDLPFAAVAGAYDATGHHQLFVAEDGTVQRHGGDGFTPVPVVGVSLAAW